MTTMEAFAQFLNGEPEETYGDKSSIVLDVVKRTIQQKIRDSLLDVHGNDDSVDEYEFLDSVFRVLSTGISAELAPEFGPLENARYKAICKACRTWTNDFASIHLQHWNRTVNLVKTSQVPNLVQALFQDVENGDFAALENDDRILRISEELLLCMRQHLDNVLRSTEPVLTDPMRGMQEGLDGDLLDDDIWQKAWNQPFRGGALHALETKLQLNADAIRSVPNKKGMSRIIPVVQASGTGKSRLSEEYGSFLSLLTYRFVTKNFGVMLSLRNGSGFPACVYLMFSYSDGRIIMCRNISRML
jgi:hypothetical protein